jgi:hypothetical protein
VSCFDRFLDLAFLSVYSTQGMHTSTQTQTDWLRAELTKVAKEVWLKQESGDIIATAQDLWKALGSKEGRRLMTVTHRGSTLRTYEEWLHLYFWDRATQRRAKKKLFMRIDPGDPSTDRSAEHVERDLLVMAWQNLIREVALWQVCLESNPSSNLVIASLDSMASQDFLHIRPTSVARRGAETLTWTISTDNPITFATSLADEYAYAWAGMVLRHEKPYDPSHARALLDEAAATSMRMRFTVKASSSEELNHASKPGRRLGPRT